MFYFFVDGGEKGLTGVNFVFLGGILKKNDFF